MKKVSNILDIVLRIVIVFVAIVNIIGGHYKFFILLPVNFILTFYNYFAKYVLKLILRDSTKIFLTVFIFLEQILAVNLDLYTIIPCWDIILHLLSGIMTYMVAEDILTSIKLKDKNFKINKVFTIIFCIVFSLACACVWELIEFSIDGVMGTNTQKTFGFAEREAVADSMEDMFAALVGCLVPAFYHIVKKDNKR